MIIMSIDKYLEEKAKRKGAIMPRQLPSHQSRIKWKKIRCQACDRVVQYVPKPGWDGRLRCSACGVWFRVPSLDSWVDEAKE